MASKRASRARCGVYDCSACALRLSGHCPGCASGNLRLRRDGQKECAVYKCVRELEIAGCHECGRSTCRLRAWHSTHCPLRGRFSQTDHWKGFQQRLAITKGLAATERKAGAPSARKTERLRGYLQIVDDYARRKVVTISSHQLARGVGVRATLVRRDLAGLGHLGRPGQGYSVAALETELRRCLRLGQAHPLIWLGGHGADWTATKEAMKSLNCALVGIFDDQWQGRKVGGLLVQPLARAPGEAKHHQAKVAVLASEEATAPSVVEGLIEAGIQAVLNLTPSRLEASVNVAIEQADIGSQLLRLLSRME